MPIPDSLADDLGNEYEDLFETLQGFFDEVSPIPTNASTITDYPSGTGLNEAELIRIETLITEKLPKLRAAIAGRTYSETPVLGGSFIE